MESAAKVYVVGSANLDLVFRTDRFPAPGETVLGRGFSTHPGGKGANQAVAVARLGGHAIFVGNIGSDFFGETLATSLSAHGVDLAHLSSDDAQPTGTAGIVVNADGANTIVVAPGANGTLRPEAVELALQESGESPVLVQLEVSDAVVETALRSPRAILNPAPARFLSEDLYRGLWAVTPNESEAALLTGVEPGEEESCARCACWFLDRGVQNVVITLGARGCYWSDGQVSMLIPAPVVDSQDTTAAGDAFNGALALFLAEGLAWPSAIAAANRAAALSTTKLGAKESMPSREELAAFEGQAF